MPMLLGLRAPGPHFAWSNILTFLAPRDRRSPPALEVDDRPARPGAAGPAPQSEPSLYALYALGGCVWPPAGRD